MSNQLNDKLAQYDILYIEKVKYFLQQPINQLYRELVKHKRQYYAPNQRIVFIDSVSTVDTKPFYAYLNRILKHLDIDECFVHIEHHGNETVANPTNFDIPETICASPWINLEIRQQGNMSPCCLYGEKKQYGTVYKQKSIPNVTTTSVKNVNFTDVRREFLEGKKPDGCNSCWQNEENNIKSKRLNDQYYYRDKIFDIDYNDIHSNNLSSLDIKLTRTCNLACRICGPSISSKWTSEVFANRKSYPQYDDVELNKKEWIDINGSAVWKDLEDITSDLSYLLFSGGEPLLDKTHGSMLQYFIDKQKSGSISIHYNTNGTQYATQLLPLWKHFKAVELSFSIDNIGDKFEYERYGESWNKVTDTITRYKNITGTNLELNVYSTISTLNILDTYQLYKLSNEYELPISFHPLLFPKQLNICLFNKKQKKYITDKLLQYNDINFLRIIEPILSLMNNTKVTTDITDMIDFLSITDKIRNQDYKQTYKELTNIL
jgi:MoaA/NifB/PqqE/SkfB family radical SAM enzyme